jgi:hypothetical protein
MSAEQMTPPGLPPGVDLSSPEAQAAIAAGLAQLKALLTAVEHLTATKVRSSAGLEGMASTDIFVLSIYSVSIKGEVIRDRAPTVYTVLVAATALMFYDIFLTFDIEVGWAGRCEETIADHIVRFSGYGRLGLRWESTSSSS